MSVPQTAQGPTDVGTTVRTVVDELGRIQRIKKCTGCECFLGVVQTVAAELEPLGLPESNDIQADLQAWLQKGEASGMHVLAVAPVYQQSRTTHSFARCTRRRKACRLEAPGASSRCGVPR